MGLSVWQRIHLDIGPLDDLGVLWNYLKIPDRPPVDVRAIAGALGVDLAPAAEPALVWRRGRACIYHRTDEHERFDIARGLSSLLQGLPPGRLLPTAGVQGALELIAPEWLLDPLIRQGCRVDDLADIFGVPMGVMRARLQDLGWT